MHDREIVIAACRWSIVCHLFAIVVVRLQIMADAEGAHDSTMLQAFRSGPSKATELLAKPKLEVHLFGYTLPERLQELRAAIALKSTFASMK